MTTSALLNLLSGRALPGRLFTGANKFASGDPSELTRTPHSNAAPDRYLPSSPSRVSQAEPTTYTRSARLDYQLDLRFDLRAIQHTATSLADGTTSSAAFAAAGFGLSAAFALNGYQVQSESGVESDGVGRQLDRSVDRESSTRATGIAGEGLSLGGFERRASSVQQSLRTDVQDQFRQAVTRFSSRFSYDSGFTLQLGERFLNQTEALAIAEPGAVGGYADTSGHLAQTSSGSALGAFFDAVDSYLDSAESALSADVVQKFDQATSALGFGGAITSAARDQLLGSISGFFSRVDAALDQMARQYGTASGSQIRGYEPAATTIDRQLAEA